MGRPAQGWKLRWRGRFYAVRFTAHGRRHEITTGKEDADRAAEEAARIYSHVQQGGRRSVRVAGIGSVAEAAEQWLNSQAAVLDPDTIATYAGHFQSCIAPFFPRLSDVTPERAARYIEHRLTLAQRQSVTKELSALRGLMRWLYGDAAPKLPQPPRRALGTPTPRYQRRGPVELTPGEVTRLLRALPRRGYGGAPVRAWFIVLYETGLRPATVAALSAPEHYRKGDRQLRIPRALDKARMGRPLPLTDAARAALDSVAPKAGLLFGWHDHREQLRVSARKVLSADRAAAICPYDFRRARLTHWAEKSSNMAGIQFLAGHSRVSTTARYVKPSLRAAEDVLAQFGSTKRKRKRKRR